MRTPEKYGAARVLWAGDAEAKEEQNRASGPYTGPLAVIRVEKHNTAEVGVPCRADR
jgi:hypothetical protein